MLIRRDDVIGIKHDCHANIPKMRVRHVALYCQIVEHIYNTHTNTHALIIITIVIKI